MNSLNVRQFLILNRDESVDLTLRKHYDLIESENNFVNIQLLYDFICDSVHSFLWKFLRSCFANFDLFFVGYWASLNLVVNDATLFNGDAV